MCRRDDMLSHPFAVNKLPSTKNLFRPQYRPLRPLMSSRRTLTTSEVEPLLPVRALNFTTWSCLGFQYPS